MKKIKSFFKFDKAFTLAELLCAIGVSSIVILTVYTMMLSAQQTFVRLSDASKNTNSFRFLVNSLRETIPYSGFYTNSGSTAFLTVPTYRNGSASTDIYWVSDLDAIVNDNAKATNIASAPTPGANSNSYNLYKKSGTSADATTMLVLSNVKKIYYSSDINAQEFGWGGYRKLNLGIIYDEVLSDKKNDTVRQKRKMLCFVAKGGS